MGGETLLRAAGIGDCGLISASRHFRVTGIAPAWPCVLTVPVACPRIPVVPQGIASLSLKAWPQTVQLWLVKPDAMQSGGVTLS